MLRLVVLIVCALAAAPLVAQQYPSRPVRMIIPFPVGSAADIIARAIEPQMRERLGQSLVIDNRGGAGGNIAGEMTARAAPDGYTVLMATIGVLSINHALYSKVNFDPIRDFTPVIYVGESPNVLVATNRLPAASVKELIALVRSKPGQLNYGSSGAGTTVHLSGELFNSMAGVKAVHVPYKGASEALTGLLGGQTDFMFASASSSIPQVKAGKLKALAVTSAQRIPSVPDLPTMTEAGVPGFVTVAWYGIVGPAGMPRPAVATLAKATLSALETRDTRSEERRVGKETR